MTLVVNRGEQLVERLREQADGIVEQAGGDAAERDADVFEGGERSLRLLDALVEAGAGMAVVAEGVEGNGR